MTKEEAIEFLWSRTRLSSKRIVRVAVEEDISKGEDYSFHTFWAYLTDSDLRGYAYSGKTMEQAARGVLTKFLRGE